MGFTDDTPLYALSVGQFKALVMGLGLQAQAAPEPEPEEPSEGREYVYGIQGIMALFKVSRTTAQKYKDTFLAPAVSQRGRTIMVDKHLAEECFMKRKDDGDL